MAVFSETKTGQKVFSLIYLFFNFQCFKIVFFSKMLWTIHWILLFRLYSNYYGLIYIL